MEKESKSVDRRNFLQSTTALAAGLTTVGTSAAASKIKKAGSDDVGITNAVSNLLKKGEIKKAEKLLDKHDVKYYSSKKNINEESVSTQATWDPNKSYVTNHVYNTDGIVYKTTASVRLKGSSSSGRYTSKAADAMGTTYFNEDWAPVDPDSDSIDYGVSYFEGSSGAPNITDADYDPNSGVGLKVKVPSEATVGYDTNMYVETSLEDRTDSSTEATPVLFEYQQNSAYSSTLSNVGISVAGVGLNINLSSAHKEWKDDVSAGPGEFSTTS
jgi:hypothetical protein